MLATSVVTAYTPLMTVSRARATRATSPFQQVELLEAVGPPGAGSRPERRRYPRGWGSAVCRCTAAAAGERGAKGGGYASRPRQSREAAKEVSQPDS